MASVTIELQTGYQSRRVTRADIQKNIDALQRASDGEPPLGPDSVLLLDTMSILKGIQHQLPRR